MRPTGANPNHRTTVNAILDIQDGVFVKFVRHFPAEIAISPAEEDRSISNTLQFYPAIFHQPGATSQNPRFC